MVGDILKKCLYKVGGEVNEYVFILVCSFCCWVGGVYCGVWLDVD